MSGEETDDLAAGTLVLERDATDTGERISFDDLVDEIDPGLYDGWFCLSTDPFPCPAFGCDFVAEFATAAHRIVVFPQNDDPRLLDLAARMMAVHRNPKVVEFEVSFGPCITYDQWEALGRPVHGIRR